MIASGPSGKVSASRVQSSIILVPRLSSVLLNLKFVNITDSNLEGTR